MWDAAPVKRTVVSAYRGKMRRIKTGYDIAARLLRFPRLPDPGFSAVRSTLTPPKPSSAETGTRVISPSALSKPEHP